MARERAGVAAPAAGTRREEAGLRVAVSPYLFRGMLVGMAAVAVAIHRTTGNRELAWRFAKARARTLTAMLGVRVEMRGREHLAGGGPFVFAPNHQSHLDILVLLGFLPGRTRFAAKRELWAHPVVGAVLDTLGMVPIERDHPERAIEALDRAAAERQSLVVFPEGTRSRTGELLPFKKGAFVIAIGAGLPIVPVVCRGTRRLMPRGSRLTVLPGEVEIVIEKPIPTAGLHYEDRDALARQVREAIERHHTGW
jgi:1-acyl-sn-glycerol-3-phosphate acyltransferase